MVDGPNIVNLDDGTPDGYIADDDVQLEHLLACVDKPTEDEIEKVYKHLITKAYIEQSYTLTDIAAVVLSGSSDDRHRIKAAFPELWNEALKEE